MGKEVDEANRKNDEANRKNDVLRETILVQANEANQQSR